MTTITPPSGADLAARRPSTVGTMKVRNGRYFDGDESYQRVSNMLKEIETDTYNLDEWKANMLAVGLAGRADLVLGVQAAAQFGPDGKLTADAKSTLRGLRSQAMDAAQSKAGANQGTAVHTATERLDLGETAEAIGLPYPYSADLTAYERLKRALGLTFRPEHIERTVRNRALSAAGTFDRIGASSFLTERGILGPDELLVVDVKTEGAPLRNLIHIAPQLAAYAYAEEMFVPEPREPTDEDPHGPARGRYEAMPAVNKTVGLVIHVRDGRAVPYLVNLVEGWEAAQAAAAQRDRMARSKRALGNAGCWALQVNGYDLGPAVDLVQERTAPELAAARERIEGQAPAAEVVGGHGPLPGPALQPVLATAVVDASHVTPGSMGAMLLEAIAQAPDVAELSRLFELASANGVEWVGPISDAGIERAKIVQCPQREMHSPATTLKCACGWRRDLQP